MFLEACSKPSSDLGQEVHELQESKVKKEKLGSSPTTSGGMTSLHVCARIERIDIASYTDEVNVCADRYDSDMCVHLWEFYA